MAWVVALAVVFGTGLVSGVGVTVLLIVGFVLMTGGGWMIARR
jgi:hypothetical protein